MAGDVKKSVQIAINIVNGVGKQVGGIVSSFGKLTESVNKATKAVGNLSDKLRKLKAPSNIRNLGNDLKGISNVDGKGINSVATGLGKLDKVKFPNFTKVNQDLAQHAKRLRDVIKAYNDLNKASKDINLKGLSSGVKQSSTQIKNLGKNTKQAGTSFSQWGFALGSASTGLSKFGTQIYGVTRGFSAVSKELNASMLIFTAAFASMFALKGVITDLVKFDDAIRAAGAVAKASSVDMMLLSDAAREMGETTRYTATQAAEALKALAMTGLDVTQAIGTLPIALNLAAAANMDLGETADIVTNIMVGYGKSVQDLPRIADLMTAAFTNSNTSLKDAGVALKYVGPVAKAAGLEIQETTGLIASLANAGYRGSKAGTTLRTAFTNLLKPTNKMSEALAAYDIHMTDLTNPNGTLHSFTEILGVMEKKGITAGDAMTVFGKRAGPGILSLIQQGLPALEEMNRKIAESEGLSMKVAYEMESGLGGSLRKLKSMWEEVGLSIGDVIKTDVDSFIKALTKTLKENKDQIVAVTVEAFKFIGAIAKMTGWAISFVSENAKLIAGLGALALAIKFVTAESKTLLGVNLAGIFMDLSKNVNFRKINIGIAALATNLGNYTKAVKAGNAATATSGLMSSFSLMGGSGVSNASKNIKRLGANLLLLGKNAAMAVSSFIMLNPWILAIAAAMGALYYITRDTSVNYEELAKETNSLADATKESTRDLEYQVAELRLINKEFERSNVDDYSNAEQRLSDVLNLSNIALSDKIDFMVRLGKGGEEYKKVAKELLEITEKEKELSDSKEQALRLKARKQQNTAIEEQARKIEKLYGVQIDNVNRLADEEIKAIKRTSDAYELYGGKGISLGAPGDEEVQATRNKNLKKEIDIYNKLQKGLAAINKTYDAFTVKAILAGKTSKDFAEELKLTGKGKAEIESLTSEFSKLEEKVNGNVKASRFLSEAGTMSMAELERANSDLINKYKEGEKEREIATLKVIRTILLAEAKGDITRQQSLDQRAKVQKDALDKNLKEANKTSKEINIFATEAVAESQEIITKLVADGETERFNIEKDTFEKQVSLNKELEKLSSDLLAKRVDDTNKRVASEKKAADAIRGINQSFEDKARSIRQRSMTDRQKDNDNRLHALKLLKDADKLAYEASRDNDKGKLKAAEALYKKAGSMADNIKSQSFALKLIKKEQAGLIDIVNEGHKIEMSLIDIKSAKDTAANDKSMKKLAEKYDKSALLDSIATQKLMKNINDVSDAEQVATKKGYELRDGVYTNILSQEEILNKKRIEGAKNLSEEVNKAAESIGDVSEDINMDITGTTKEGAKPEAIMKSLDAVIEKIKSVDSDLEVRILTSADGKDVGERVDEINTDVAGIEVDVPINISVEKLERVLEIIAEINQTNINVQINVDSGEMNTTASILKDIKSKIVQLTINVAGYDKLVKAKNMMDSIRSKTVVLTTRHKSVTEKAAGGFIGPEQYADGGNVFRKLPSPFISKGGGRKDDVPAMLMKGEFVQKVSAVQKYGKRFMARLNAGLIPKSVSAYASGGLVGSKKKKLDELFSDKLSSISSKTIDGTSFNTEIGARSIEKLSSAFANSVGKFANGGSIEDTIKDSANTGKSILGGIDTEIQRQKKQGNIEIENVLKKERKQIIEVNKALSEELKILKSEYYEALNNVDKENQESINGIDIENDKAISDINAKHQNSMAGATKEYLGKEGSAYSKYREDMEEADFNKKNKKFVDPVREDYKTDKDWEKAVIAVNQERDEAHAEHLMSVKKIENEYKNSVDIAKSERGKLKRSLITENSTLLEAQREVYLKNINDQKSKRSEDIDELNKQYKLSVGEKKSESLETISGIKKAIAEEIVDIKNSIYQASVQNIPPKSSATSSSVIDELKKKLGIKGFNTGGFINPTSTSTNGKDSILAAVAPSEYVIRASAVRKFGKGFFDSLNNFQIPHFNSGGIVGNIDSGSLLNGGITETVRHALDLTINGSRQGELTGSQTTIGSILNDLTLAKLRS